MNTQLKEDLHAVLTVPSQYIVYGENGLPCSLAPHFPYGEACQWMKDYFKQVYGIDVDPDQKELVVSCTEKSCYIKYTTEGTPDYMRLLRVDRVVDALGLVRGPTDGMLSLKRRYMFNDPDTMALNTIYKEMYKGSKRDILKSLYKSVVAHVRLLWK